MFHALYFRYTLFFIESYVALSFYSPYIFSHQTKFIHAWNFRRKETIFKWFSGDSFVRYQSEGVRRTHIWSICQAEREHTEIQQFRNEYSCRFESVQHCYAKCVSVWLYGEERKAASRSHCRKRKTHGAPYRFGWNEISKVVKKLCRDKSICKT